MWTCHISLCIYKTKKGSSSTLSLIYSYGYCCWTSTFQCGFGSISFTSVQIRIWIVVRLCCHKTKVEFLHGNTLRSTVNRTYNILCTVWKPFWKDWKSRFFVNFGQFSYSWIRIRIHNTDPVIQASLTNEDPDQNTGFSVLLLKALLFGTTLNLWHRYHFNILTILPSFPCYDVTSL